MIPKEYIEKVKSHYMGDEKKSLEWWATPMFGIFSPLEMVKLGKLNQVKKYIDTNMCKYY